MAGQNYQDYLQISKLLDCQKLQSEEANRPAHDELLFITVHQTYELWFKQILKEVGSILEIFEADKVDEQNMGIIVARLERVIKIQKVMIEQIDILETMTPLDFLDFRDLLYPASGFQSYQFRLTENKLGLRPSDRLVYNHLPYHSYFNEEERDTLLQSEKDLNLWSAVEGWLERTPFLQTDGFDFWQEYRKAADAMFNNEEKIILENAMLSDEDKKKNLQILQTSRQQFAALFDPVAYENMRSQKVWRLSYKAAHAALLIQLYRHQPIFQLPFRLITTLLDMDDFMTSWRYRHSLMARRMLGTKIGTGGSSGSTYLKQSADHHKIFDDFFKLTTFFIPKSELPELPEKVKKLMRFNYEESLS